MTWRIDVGDCRELLRQTPAGSVQTCVTSPPYFGLRDYGHDGQIGLEPTPDEFVAALVEVFREVRRVLRDDGTVWLNLGDSYSGSPVGSFNGGGFKDKSAATGGRDLSGHAQAGQANKANLPGIKPKDLIGIPWMVAFALRADGWYLRSDIIWSKLNPMPESVTDRPTKAHEYVFLLSKSARYFYDADAIREDVRSADDPRGPDRMVAGWDEAGRRGISPGATNGHLGIPAAGRNKRSVWTVPTQPFPGAHFATFPPKLIEPCILAGTSPKACGVCGAPWQRVVERTAMVVKPTPKRAEWQATDDHARTQVGGTMLEAATSRTVGWASSCEHDDDTGSCVVLDPFAGSGTVGVVCGWHGRDFVGLELNDAYAAMARDRITAEGKPWRPKSDPPKVHADQMGLLG